MASQKHPSEAGFQIGRIYARALYRLGGEKVKAVLLTGSNAIGMSLPTSDIDLVVVLDGLKPGEQWSMENVGPVFKAQNEIIEKIGKKFNISIIPASEFVRLSERAYTPGWRSVKFPAKQIRDAALPVFVQKEFEPACKAVLEAQNHAQTVNRLLERCAEKGNPEQRNAFRLNWQRKGRPIVAAWKGR